MKNKLEAVDLFCGGGGLSQGLSDAGVKIVAAFDNWDAAINFYRRNITGHPAEKLDLLDSDAVSAHLKKFTFNMIVGGPPCQDFSSAGKRDESGGRANLTISFAKIVCNLLPKYFIMENVDRAQKTKTFSSALEIFRNAGYGLTVSVLDASLCGVPQKRKRVVVFGMLNGSHNALIPALQKNQASKPLSIRDCFGNSFGVQHYYRHPRSYARRGIFSIDEPSPTIRGVNRPVPQGYPGHPGDAAPLSKHIRPLTTKERSLIQTFPKSWDVSGNKSEVEQIIGNAVPVKLAEFMGKCLFETLSNQKKYRNCKIDGSGCWTLFEQRSSYCDQKAA
ncbi:DNA (cytosine-5-)-methyltransferase [Oscillatoria laete-virens NRMC-F 0139]|nr:DNA (cytosine-5-)-methyltransferase [Oscillatoria laete-virens]MDL5052977.1 DNA (cytosine-5-)-methyltransferase [Oscillatoria laete-virens NRMC-F 0139]